MLNKSHRLGMAALAAAFLLGSGAAFAQNPAPAGGAKPADKPAAAPAMKHDDAKGGVKAEDVAKAVEAQIKKSSEANKGMFKMTDTETKAEVALTFVSAAPGHCGPTGSDAWMACADFKSADGKKYDVDFKVTGADKDHLMVVDPTIHSVDGKERYKWEMKDGMMMKVMPEMKKDDKGMKADAKKMDGDMKKAEPAKPADAPKAPKAEQHAAMQKDGAMKAEAAVAVAEPAKAAEPAKVAEPAKAAEPAKPATKP